MVRKIKAKLVLRLRSEGLSRRQIAAQGMSRRSVDQVIAAAVSEGLTYDDVATMSDADVYERLFAGRGEHHSVYAQPEWGEVHRELAKVGVTLKLLHGEYRDAAAAAGSPVMGYDRFCKTYQQHILVAGLASRVGHKAGQSIEVDWSGKTMVLTDAVTGKQAKVFLFVGCLPFSRYAFVEPALDMKQDTWLRAHVAMFGWFGGSVPRIVPDNLKTGVISHPAEGEVVLNDAYRELAAHYSAAVLPGRVRKPKDKASVENTVGNIATQVIAALRHRSFSTLPELREAIYERMDEYNAGPFQKRAGSRLSVFEAEEKALLRPLPAVAYEISRWVYGRRARKDGHVVFEKNFYSVPYAFVGRSVDLRVTASMLEVFDGDRRLTSHLLAPAGVVNAHRTHDADLPDGPQYREWNAPRVREWAGRIGENTTVIVNRIFESVPVDEQGLDAALAVLRLTRRFSAGRVEAAATVALTSKIRSPRYAHLRPILDSGQDVPQVRRKPRFVPSGPDDADSSTTSVMGYVRGADYYAGGER
ncbi:IS21 family transposase [Pseudoclavibacter helvolus]|uniref:IS21 family transposase n=1 Tax=Pseudoclavibacter helvolus TaxID=255205 RepID=UPI0024AE7744|nr:IS21 family transposase [Pseudoclavibacter helvolus]